MNRRAMRWAAGCGALGAIMLAFGIHDATSFRAGRGDTHQVLTLGQVVDIIAAVVLLVFAGLLVIGQLRAHRRLTRHRRWMKDHPG